MSPTPSALVVSAHAADFVWRAGGAIASHARRGWQVKIICLSFGERGESAKLWRQPGMTLDKVKAEGHNPGQPVLGAPPVYAFEPHQPEQCGWEPNTFLDITDVWETKHRAIACMQGQEHLWHYYTRVAQQRGVQARRNLGITTARNIEYAEGFMRLTPTVVDAL